uniref:Uncharacterized protein n=1 Tax=Dendroctonus ponderosae TaxID=77166 RepID=A0AAR5PKS3_DENPD
MSEDTHLAELEVEASVQITEETTVEMCEADEDEDDQATYQISDGDSPIQTNGDECTIKKIKPILKPGSLDIHIEPVVCESSLSLEEQLAAVQKQLLALSQLPSAIQVTLEAVTKQLNKIVLEKTTQVQEASSEDYESNHLEPTNGFGSFEEEDVPEENLSVSENAEGDITENEADDQPSFDDLEHDHAGSEAEEQGNEADEAEEVEEPLDPYAGLTEEEKEAKIREEKLLSKKLKVNHWNRIWPWGDKEKPVYSSRESNCCMVPSKALGKLVSS